MSSLPFLRAQHSAPSHKVPTGTKNETTLQVKRVIPFQFRYPHDVVSVCDGIPSGTGRPVTPTSQPAQIQQAPSNFQNVNSFYLDNNFNLDNDRSPLTTSSPYQTHSNKRNRNDFESNEQNYLFNDSISSYNDNLYPNGSYSPLSNSSDDFMKQISEIILGDELQMSQTQYQLLPQNNMRPVEEVNQTQNRKRQNKKQRVEPKIYKREHRLRDNIIKTNFHNKILHDANHMLTNLEKSTSQGEVSWMQSLANLYSLVQNTLPLPAALEAQNAEREMLVQKFNLIDTLAREIKEEEKFILFQTR